MDNACSLFTIAAGTKEPNPFTIAAGTQEPLPLLERWSTAKKDPSKGGRPPKPMIEQTAHLERERERLRLFRQAHPGRNAETSRRSRAKYATAAGTQELITNILTSTQEMDRLLDWHATCPGSYAFPPDEEYADDSVGPIDDPIDHHRYLSTPPKAKPKSHHDE